MFNLTEKECIPGKSYDIFVMKDSNRENMLFSNRW